MDRDQHLINYYKLMKEQNLKEYIFMTRSGYRKKFVLGKNLKDAEENFMKIDIIKRNGFDLNDLPIRLEFDEEKCKNWKIEDYWNNNENKNIITE